MLHECNLIQINISLKKKHNIFIIEGKFTWKNGTVYEALELFLS